MSLRGADVVGYTLTHNLIVSLDIHFFLGEKEKPVTVLAESCPVGI